MKYISFALQENKKYQVLILFIAILLSVIFVKVVFTKSTEKKGPQVPYIPQDGKAFVIAENKNSLAPIILPKDNTPFMQEAARDLASYIEKISGAKTDIIEGMPNPMPAKAIWVGYQKGIEKLFPGINLTYQYPEEIINAANEHHILISGRDRWNPNAMSIPDRTGKRMVNGIQQEYGTCNAVYTFLQDQLNVRWFWPGPMGEDVIKSDRISIAPFSYRYHPVIQDRGGIFHLLRIISNKGSKDEHKWARLQRIQLSSLYLDSRHAFSDWWAKYGEKHPDYFALLPNGKRAPYRAPEDVKICQSNPRVWDAWMQEVETQLQVNPNQTIFSAAANDGWSQGHCTCSNCKAWDGPDGPDGKPILSDRDVTFANKLAQKLKQKYPDKDYQVLIMGYGYTRPAPQKTKPDDNVIILNVSNFHLRGDGEGDTRTLSMQQYEDWGKLTSNMGWRPNLGSPVGLSIGMPDVAPRQSSIDFQFVAKYGCKGLFFDAYWNHWSTQALQYYVDAQLAWNPYQDIEKLLEDYFSRAYGPAATEMKAYWKMMEDTRNEMVTKVKTRTRFNHVEDFYTDQWFEKAEALLNKAKEKTKTHSGPYAERIKFTEYGFLFTRLTVDTKKNMNAWELNPKNTKAKEAVLANWEKAKTYRAQFPPLAINFTRNYHNPKANFMKGMHPDNPLDARKMNAALTEQGKE